MNDAPEAQTENGDQSSFFIGVGVGVLVLTILLVAAAVVLALNASTTSPAVRVIRDVMIIITALELIVIGVAITVFIMQLARFVNLMNNEVQPIITSTTDTINAVRGTATFLSKHLTEPVIAANSALRGLGKVMKDVDAIREVVRAAESAAGGGRSRPADSAAEREKDSRSNQSAEPASNDSSVATGG